MPLLPDFFFLFSLFFKFIFHLSSGSCLDETSSGNMWWKASNKKDKINCAGAAISHLCAPKDDVGKDKSKVVTFIIQYTFKALLTLRIQLPSANSTQ